MVFIFFILSCSILWFLSNPFYEGGSFRKSYQILCRPICYLANYKTLIPTFWWITSTLLFFDKIRDFFFYKRNIVFFQNYSSSVPRKPKINKINFTSLLRKPQIVNQFIIRICGNFEKSVDLTQIPLSSFL